MERKALDNPLNSTQNSPNTSNPQDAGTANGASNAADFQSTAPYDALNQQTDELSVQETGEPLSGTSFNSSSSNAVLYWTIGIVVLLAAILLAFKLIKEAIDDDHAAESPVKKAGATAKKPATKSKKATAKKKSAPNQRRKKSTKARRK